MEMANFFCWVSVGNILQMSWPISSKIKGIHFQWRLTPKREMYGKFASMFIPRTYLIGREGTILYQSVGYDEEEFDRLLAAVKDAF
jgi:peroxiredoxin